MSAGPGYRPPFSDWDDSFTLPIGPAGGVELMAPALARKLAEVATRGERHIVGVVLEGTGWHYTQCLIDPDRTWVEAVSNDYIEPAELRLDADQEAVLAALGFEPPDDESPNHHRVFDHPVPWSLVAELLTIPIVAVYGAGHHERVRVDVTPAFADHPPPTDHPIIPGQPTREEMEVLVAAIQEQAGTRRRTATPSEYRQPEKGSDIERG